MQSKLTLALVASSLAVGSLAAPQAGATTVDGIVIPSSIISVAYADVTSILAEVPSSVLAAVATISGLPTDEAGIISAVSEFAAGSTPAWFSALTEVVPTAVQTSILGAAESAIMQFEPYLSEIDTLTSTASGTAAASTLTTTSALGTPTGVLPPVIGNNGTAPYANGTITPPRSSSTVAPSGTTSTSLPSPSHTNGAVGLSKMGVASLMALSGVLGLAVLL